MLRNMAADADELRPDVAEQNAQSLEELQARTRDDTESHAVDVDEAEAAENFEASPAPTSPTLKLQTRSPLNNRIGSSARISSWRTTARNWLMRNR